MDFYSNNPGSAYGLWILILEIGCGVIPAAILITSKGRKNQGALWLAVILAVIGICINRWVMVLQVLAAPVLTFEGWAPYYPSWQEIATTLLPVALGVLSRHHADTNLSRVLLLGVAYGASIGGVATLTGSPPNAIAAGLLDISFLQWLIYGLPVSLSMLVVAIPVLWWTYRPEQKQIIVNLGEDVRLTENGNRTLVVLGITLFLWLFGPSLGKWLAIPPALFSSAAVACIALALLVLSRCVKWKELEQGIHWGVLILLAGGLTLGRGLTESGAADWLAGLLASSTGDLSFFTLLLILVTIGVFATELISNTAVTAKLAPILMGVALQFGLEAESLVVPVAIGTSMAFMLPVATPPNALVHDSGYITQRDMMRAGLRLNVVAIVVITLLFHYGLAG